MGARGSVFGVYCAHCIICKSGYIGAMDEQVEDSIERKKASNNKKLIKASKISLPDGSVEPFPRERFLAFLDVLRVQTKDYGLVGLRLLGSQLYVLDKIIEGLNDGITTFVILKARQLGISTLFLALDLFWAFEHPGLLGCFVTHDEAARDQFRNQLDVFLTTLPKTHSVDYETNNRLMLVLKNSSLFRYLVAGTRTTTNKLGRSGGSNFCHATECAFYGSADDIKALGQTFSELYKYRLYVYESTANGFNHYYDMYETAKASPAMKAIFIGWWRDERNELGENHPLYLKYMPAGTKTPLTPEEREKVNNVKREYGFKITAGQMAWYRFHLETKCDGDQATMDQEMPWTAEDAFVSTGDSFFTNDVLTYAMREAKKSKCMPFIIQLNDRFQDTRMLSCNISTAQLKIWEVPSKFGKYVIGADPTYGSSPSSDNGVISVFRCYADGCDQVAEYAGPSVSTFQFAWVLAFLAGLYKDVVLNLEITGPGTPVYQELGQLRQKLATIVPGDDPDMRNCLRHMKDFYYRRADSMSGNVVKQWKTSPETRGQLLHKFHDGVMNKRIRIRSLMALEEMRKVVIDHGDGYIGAPAGKKDDRVIASALAYWAWDENIRPGMYVQGLTRARAEQIDEQGGVNPIEGLVERFMKDAKITVNK